MGERLCREGLNENYIYLAHEENYALNLDKKNSLRMGLTGFLQLPENFADGNFQCKFYTYINDI
jgi:predicted component of type VI protein secretion system